MASRDDCAQHRNARRFASWENTPGSWSEIEDRMTYYTPGITQGIVNGFAAEKEWDLCSEIQCLVADRSGRRTGTQSPRTERDLTPSGKRVALIKTGSRESPLHRHQKSSRPPVPLKVRSGHEADPNENHSWNCHRANARGNLWRCFFSHRPNFRGGDWASGR
jgi:hypothetical protein